MLEAAADAGLHGANQYAYMLATAERESHLGNMPDEDRSDKWFNNHYGPQTAKGQELGNTQKGDGALYHGRGLVQITGRRNYADWTQRLNDQGVKVDGADADLVNHPEQAKDPKIAAKIAAEGMRDGTFTTRKLGDYVNDDKTDYVNARRVINGKDDFSREPLSQGAALLVAAGLLDGWNRRTLRRRRAGHGWTQGSAEGASHEAGEQGAAQDRGGRNRSAEERASDAAAHQLLTR
jgi:hypothetical protein